ncbi:DUF429 domain-containing protein [Kocuria indica]|uniref:DUF429 domain-containing protein n=2 Tax=Micrococcaceae TaxID=1268 RepID=A0A6N9QXB9_9MICC|nr:DUF429 domain-containing protein [Kocuria indica]
MDMTYIGIDLAASEQRTGLAELTEDAGSIVVRYVSVGATDLDLVRAIRTAQRVGVDIPFGWPDAFVDVLTAHSRGTLVPPADTGSSWRRTLAMRAADRWIQERTGLTPLSVSTDRIAHPALRWAGIEAELRASGVPVPRDGSGVVCEVYPAAALKCWSLPHRGYKGKTNVAQRSRLMSELSDQAPWLDWGGFRDVCAADDNALDAVLAALVAREVDLERCEPIPEELRSVSLREGWIWLPRGTPTPLAT